MRGPHKVIRVARFLVCLLFVCFANQISHLRQLEMKFEIRIRNQEIKINYMAHAKQLKQTQTQLKLFKRGDKT